MTIHYHGTPITPAEVLVSLRGRHFCVSHFRPDQVRQAHDLGQSVLLDNGAFSRFTALKRDMDARRKAGEQISDDDYYERLHAPVDWKPYYEWCDLWLAHPTTWAIIPDVIEGASQLQDGLINEWPFGHRGAPVWHSDEPLDRLLRLLDAWPRVCIGSAGETWRIWKAGFEGRELHPAWERMMDGVWEAITARHRRSPWVHMLRGMALAGRRWPFASVDSTDLARNHNRLNDFGDDKLWAVEQRAARWDERQCPPTWLPAEPKPTQPYMFVDAA